LSSYTVILADDHPLFRGGLKKILGAIPDLEVVGEAGDGLTLLELLKKTCPHLVILDISMPHLRGLEAAREIKATYPQVKILLLTMHKKEEFLRAGIKAGVDGFLLKDDAEAELIQAIHKIRRGEKFFSNLLADQLVDLVTSSGKEDRLTNRERQIVKLLAEGKTAQEIADLLYISIFTVRRHRDNIMRKLNLKRLADLVRYALEQELTSTNS